MPDEPKVVEDLHPVLPPASYEPPRVTFLGNARDLLGGGFGTQDDGLCSTPGQTTRSPAGPFPPDC
jgi:hypothetical protein